MNFYISYSQADEYAKLQITRALEKAGHSVSGTLYGVSMVDYDRAMDTQIRSVLAADAVIAVLSPEAVRDENLEMDFETALRSDIPIWAVVVSGGQAIENVPLPRLIRGKCEVCDVRGEVDEVVAILSQYFVAVGLAFGNNGAIERECYGQAIDIDPNNPNPYNLRGCVYDKQKMPDEAIADFSAAIRLNPSYIEAYANRARQYRMMQKYDLALADCAAALRLDPTHRMAYIIRGNIEIKLGQYVEAVRDFDAALVIDPQDALSYANRGHAKCLLGQMDAALADCNHALMLDPQCWVAHLFRGEVYRAKFENKRHIEPTDPLLDLALKDFNAVLHSLEEETAYYGRAKIRYWKGDRQGAIADCQMALTLNPQHSAADRMRTFIEHEGKSHLLGQANNVLVRLPIPITDAGQGVIQCRSALPRLLHIPLIQFQGLFILVKEL